MKPKKILFITLLLLQITLLSNAKSIDNYYDSYIKLSGQWVKPQTSSISLENSYAFYGSYHFLSSFLDSLYFDFQLGFLPFQPRKLNYQFTYYPLDLGITYDQPLIHDLSLFLRLGFGPYLLKTSKDHYSTNYFYNASIGFNQVVFNHFIFSVQGSYNFYNDPQESIKTLQFGLSVGYIFSKIGGDIDIKINEAKINNLFALHYNRYYKESVGEVEIENTGKDSLHQIEASLWVKNFMNKKSVSKSVLPLLLPGKKKKIPVYAFFDPAIKNLDSEVLAQGILEITYKNQNGKIFTQEKTIPIQIFHKNAMLWDDLNRLGSFIQPNDPEIINFSRKTLTLLKAVNQLPENLDQALKIFLTLRNHGIQYVSDPKSSYKSMPGQIQLIDHVQFARETLKIKTGDCDDFSVLYATLIESVGIPTAIVATHNHVFILFLAPKEVQSKVISFEGKNWIPINITQINNSFLQAWESGYKLYTETADKTAKTIYEMMNEYQSFIPDEPISIHYSLNTDQLIKNYQEETQFILENKEKLVQQKRKK